MKKLMIIASVALVAVSAQAAKFSWGFYSENFCDEGGSGDLTGYTAYLVDATTWSGIDAGDATSIGAALAKNIATASLDDAGGFDTDGYYYEYGPTELKGQDVATETGADYMLVFDNGEKFYAVDVSGDIWDDADNTQGQKPFYNANLALDTSDFTSYASTPGPGPSGDVPEPTSGLLMLVGLAGLTLRRRRA